MAKRKGQATAAKGERVYRLSTPSGALTEEEFQDELVRRIEEFESGKVQAVPLEDVMAEIRAKARRPRGGH